MAKQLSYWETTSFFNFDTVIIGSGIVGLSAAIHLKKTAPGLKVAILERGFLPAGASTKNAGFACFGSISELMEQERTSGSEKLAALVEKRWKGLLKLRTILGDKAVDYQQLGGYELFKSNDVPLYETCVAKIEHYNQLLKFVTGSYSFCIDDNKILKSGFKGITGLIANRHEAQIDTGKMMLALIQYAQHLGCMVFNNCDVEEILEGKKLIIKSKNGSFSAKSVIITTNAFVNKLIAGLDVKPGRGQVLITKPIKNLKIEGSFHYDKGYYYFRNINNRVLLGGGRNLDFKGEETAAFGLTATVQDALERLLSEVILPETDFEIDQRWSGIMAFGKELEPIVKEARPKVYCAVRCNGMGVAMGSQTGEDVAELVLKSL
ncbi:FAD-binding oxidoreductase [Pedobacter sp. Leaf194]|uniref:NAD(P)/FAD-dependent oxidoreductase n=1 Tax=Pedobacter sp. Leaf194 TaxID=1736297 RepID=UPI0007025CA4|nr:FAD-dependent oxidoreductase [Pedobacter sp. Leaf194]KQS41074.1 FAD-dependent oxidoreductase [Pedobacter sp. Leaf194]